MNKCPCGSGRDFDACCEPFIQGDALPSVPEELMRSRYTAYTLANIAYIRRTQTGKTARTFDVKSAKMWAESVEWVGLTVINTSEEGARGTVEFCAEFKDNGELKQLHEVSQFYRDGKRWVYLLP